ncbi:META domain-containing protein [Salinimicrobium sp. GXAS 041]|uniref:META domain-containing protein n=1 Tax=Salinimicrobium sp. GXAS 041 TaxID=3400806 RepID=UPI003C73B976
MRAFLLVFIIVSLTSCGNIGDTVSDDQLNGRYYLTDVAGVSVSSAEEIVLEFNPIGNIVRGNTGCNDFSANYHQDGRALEFTMPITTRKYCEGKMKTEGEILSSFEEAVKFIRTGNDYIFLSSEDEQLITLTKKN